MITQLLREKFRQHPEALHDKEVMGLTGVILPNSGVEVLRYLDMSVDELKAEGFTEADAIGIKAIKEMAVRYLSQRMTKRDTLTSPQRVVDFLRMSLVGLPHEAFAVVFLNTQNEVITHEVINEGTIDQVAVYPRRIIEKALANHAAGIIVSHNHPSGYTEPSEEDKRLTRSLKDAAHLLDIRLLDHIIVGKSGYFSFREGGIL